MSAIANRSQDRARRFYFGMALTGLTVSVAGFLSTYFLPLAHHAFHRPPAVHLHGVGRL